MNLIVQCPFQYCSAPCVMVCTLQDSTAGFHCVLMVAILINRCHCQLCICFLRLIPIEILNMLKRLVLN